MKQPLTFDRVVTGGLGRVKILLDRVYAARHPGWLERRMIALAAPLVRRMTPNDRWSLGVHAPWWVRPVSGVASPPKERRRRIFMFCAYRGQFTIDLTFISLLLARGHHVTFAYIPKLRSPIKPPLADDPSVADYLEDALSRVEQASGGRVTVVNLADYEDAQARPDAGFVKRQTTSDAVMKIQRESLDENNPADAEVMDYYRDNGLRAHRMAWGYLSNRRDQFDLAIVGNGTTFEGAYVCEVLSRLEIPLNTYEKFAFRNVRVINHGDDFRSFLDLDLVWTNRDELGYSGAYRAFAVAKARALVDARRRSSTETWAWALQRQPLQETDEALRVAGVDPSKPFVLVCTNVPYDAGYDKLCRHFRSMREWLIHTVRTLMERTELQVVVRAHPGEAAYYGGKERSDVNLAEAGFVPGERLIVIPGEVPVNTYGLMERCKFGIVFSSTTGLEMAMMGKRVLVGADVYYGGRGFTTDVENRADYDARLVELAATKASLALSEQQSDDAALFHFMLHHVMQWPYPWHKGGEAAALTPEHLVQSRAFEKFLPTIDALALPATEFRARLAEFLSVENARHLPRPEKTDAPRIVPRSAEPIRRFESQA